ncbi:MAG: spore maturation protein A [Oscillospiraceae bacterium]|jgi:spore maturation protein A|nr:spore maturation protein A [Oscillospiraceae bacterium]
MRIGRILIRGSIEEAGDHMMKWMFSGLILIAVVFGLLNGRMNEVTNAALNECGNAVQLCITLMGTMCMWSGLMKIAEKSKLTEKMSAFIAPVIGRLFGGLDHRSPAAQAITLNLSANLLGLGNAATPLGIHAMKELHKMNGASDTASDNMILFVVLNTASLQLVPTTTALLRAKAGSAMPLDILPAVICASFASITVGIIVAKTLSAISAAKGGQPSVRKKAPSGVPFLKGAGRAG